MSYTSICPTCLARQGAPVGGKLVSQEIERCAMCRGLGVVWVYRAGARVISITASCISRSTV